MSVDAKPRITRNWKRRRMKERMVVASVGIEATTAKVGRCEEMH